MINLNDNNKYNISIEEINSIPFDLLLRYLKINYIQKGNTLQLFEGNSLTRGWRCKIDDNFVTDFSLHGRPSGNPFSFIRDILKINGKYKSDKDVFKFFYDFKNGIEDFSSVLIESSERKIINNEKEIERKEKVKEMLGFYDELESDEEGLNYYLKTRKINIKKIPKDVINEMKVGTIYFDGIWYSDKMFIPMKNILIDENGDIKIDRVGIKARAIGKIKDKAFKSISIKDSYIGFYFSNDIINTKNTKTLFICEGETDGLSLFSGGFKNVVWNLGGVGYTNENMNKIFRKFDKIIIAYDLDEPDSKGKRPGEEGIKKIIKSIGLDKTYYFINYNKIIPELKKRFNIEVKGKIDVNDVLKYCGGNDNIFREIFIKGFEIFDKNKLLKELKEKEIKIEKEKNKDYKIIKFKN